MDNPRTLMNLLVRDVLLSFCPAAARRNQEFGSTVRVTRAAGIAGLLQMVFFAVVQMVRYRHFLALRLEQFAPVVRGSSEAIQSAGLVVVTLEFLIQPLSLLFTYFLLEGCVRAISAVLFEEALPSLSVFLGFASIAAFRQKKLDRQMASLPADTLELLEGERLRIASCRPKPGWNATITVTVRGHWYELEREEQGRPPHSYVYILTRASMGRVLRGFQEYDANSAVPLDMQQDGTAGR